MIGRLTLSDFRNHADALILRAKSLLGEGYAPP